MIADLIEINLVLIMNGQGAVRTYKAIVIRHANGTDIKEKVVIWAKANKIIKGIWPVVRSPQWANMGGFRVGTSRPAKL